MQDHHLLSDGLHAVLSWWKRARENMHNGEELAHLSDAEIAIIAEDCGVSVDQFTRIVRKGPHAADELDEMLVALGLSRADFSRETQREMTLACAECDCKRTCKKSLAGGHAAAEFRDYCANAERLSDALAG